MSVVDPGPLVPVTVIGGYLGAGKTTLINRLLGGDHGRRVAVLVNDFGDINIDLELIEHHDGATIGLTNGCVCCSIADALGDGLDRVLGLDPPPDQIVIEASGVADPAKIAAYGRGWPGCRLDSVLVLADAETIRARSTDRFVGELVGRQLAAADLVLVTKCDLIDSQQIVDVVRWVAAAAEGPVVPIHHGDVDTGLVLASATSRTSGPDPTPDPDRHPDPDPDPDRGLGGGEPDAEHLFESATLRVEGPLRPKDLERALSTWPDSIVRVKGVAHLNHGDPSRPNPATVHRVGRRWSIDRDQEPQRHRDRGPDRDGDHGGDQATVLVVIALAGTLTGPLHPDRLTAELIGRAEPT